MAEKKNYHSFVFYLGLYLGMPSGAIYAWSIIDAPDIIGRKPLVSIYESVNLGDSDTVVAKKMVTISSEGPISISTVGDKSSARSYVSTGNDSIGDWILSLCFKDQYLEGVHFGTNDDVDILPRDAPSGTLLPKGVCTYRGSSVEKCECQ